MIRKSLQASRVDPGPVAEDFVPGRALACDARSPEPLIFAEGLRAARDRCHELGWVLQFCALIAACHLSTSPVHVGVVCLVLRFRSLYGWQKVGEKLRESSKVWCQMFGAGELRRTGVWVAGCLKITNFHLQWLNPCRSVREKRRTWKILTWMHVQVENYWKLFMLCWNCHRHKVPSGTLRSVVPLCDSSQ